MATHRGQERWTLPQGVQLPALLRAKPAPLCGESIWVFLPAEKAKQSAKRSFLQQTQLLCFPDGDRARGGSSRLTLPTAKGVQGWLFVGREKSDRRRVIAWFLGQVFLWAGVNTASQATTSQGIYEEGLGRDLHFGRGPATIAHCSATVDQQKQLILESIKDCIMATYANSSGHSQGLQDFPSGRQGTSGSPSVCMNSAAQTQAHQPAPSKQWLG